MLSFLFVYDILMVGIVLRKAWCSYRGSRSKDYGQSCP